MANKRVDRLEVGAEFPKAPNNEVVWIDVENNNINRYDKSTEEWISVGGSPAGTFDDPILKDNVRFTNSNDDVRLRIEHGGTGVVRIHAPEDDLALRSANDILLYAGDDGPGNVYIGWGDATYTPDSSNRVATIGDIQQGTTGDITFDGIQIIGDGTMELVPDSSLNSDQYLVIDPTAPNHIHIRAGGTQDASTADLIIGGENTNVLVSDTGDYVDIRTTSASNSYIWRFGSEGVFSGPVNQYVTVNGLNITNNRNLYLGGEDMGGYFSAPVRLSPGSEMGTNIPFFELVSKGTATFSSIDSDIILQTYNGESYITSVDPDNKIATLGDLPSGATGAFQTATHDITVTNGIITSIDAL